MGDIVFRLERAGRFLQGLQRVALVAHDRTVGAARGLFQFTPERLAVIGAVVAVFPFDHQGLAAAHGCPGVGGNDGHPAKGLELGRLGRRVDHHDPLDTRHLQRGGGIMACHTAAIDGRAGNHRKQHPFGLGVDAIDGAAGDDVGIVDQPDVVAADIAELVRGFQRQAFTRRNLATGCPGRHVAIARLPPGCGMGKNVVLGRDLIHGHAPFGSRGLAQHLPGGGACAPHRMEEVAQTARPVGVLVAEGRLVPRRLGNADAGPVRIQFIRHGHGDRGADPLPHFRSVHGHRDGAVGVDGDKDAGIVLPAMRHGIGPELQRFVLRGGGQAKRQDQGARAHSQQNGTAADIFQGGHHPASCPAARLIAARMRGYVPQRQMFWVITPSMSSSVGSGVSASRAAACIICPDWQ